MLYKEENNKMFIIKKNCWFSFLNIYRVRILFYSSIINLVYFTNEKIDLRFAILSNDMDLKMFIIKSDRHLLYKHKECVQLSILNIKLANNC